MSNKRAELYFIDNFRLCSTDTESQNYKTSSKWPAVTFVQSDVIVIIMKCAREIFPTPTNSVIRMKYSSASTKFCQKMKQRKLFIFRGFVGLTFLLSSNYKTLQFRLIYELSKSTIVHTSRLKCSKMNDAVQVENEDFPGCADWSLHQAARSSSKSSQTLRGQSDSSFRFGEARFGDSLLSHLTKILNCAI